MAEASHGETAAQHDTVRRHEQPEDWGWHGAWGKWARIGGWISVVSLILLNFTFHYNNQADSWIYGLAALLVFMLLRDRHRRKNAWRE